MFGLQILDEGDVVWVDGDLTKAARVVRTERAWLGDEDDTVVVEWSSQSKENQDRVPLGARLRGRRATEFSRGRLYSALREGDRVQIPRSVADTEEDVPGIPNAPLTAEDAFCGPGSSEDGPDLEASMAGSRPSRHSIPKRCTITPCLDGEQGQFYSEATVIKVPPAALLAVALEDADDKGLGTDKKGVKDDVDRVVVVQKTASHWLKKTRGGSSDNAAGGGSSPKSKLENEEGEQNSRENAVLQSPSEKAASRGLYVVKLDGMADGHFQAYHRNAMIEIPKVPIEAFSPFFVADLLIGDPIKNQSGMKNACKASILQTLLLGIPSCIFPVIAAHLDIQWVSKIVTLWVIVYHLTSIGGSCLYYTKQVPWRRFRYIVAITSFMLSIQVTITVFFAANTTFWLLAMITVRIYSIVYVCSYA
jgi:hypothetical protein